MTVVGLPKEHFRKFCDCCNCRWLDNLCYGFSTQSYRCFVMQDFGWKKERLQGNHFSKGKKTSIIGDSTSDTVGDEVGDAIGDLA